MPHAAIPQWRWQSLASCWKSRSASGTSSEGVGSRISPALPGFQTPGRRQQRLLKIAERVQNSNNVADLLTSAWPRGKIYVVAAQEDFQWHLMKAEKSRICLFYFPVRVHLCTDLSTIYLPIPMATLSRPISYRYRISSIKHPLLYLDLSTSTCLPICLPVCLSVCLFICLLSTCLTPYLSIYLPICLFLPTYRSFNPLIYLSHFWFICYELRCMHACMKMWIYFCMLVGKNGACMHAHMYVPMYLSIHLSIDLSIYVCMYVCKYDYICMYVSMCVCVYVCVCMYVCVYVCMCACACMYVCMSVRARMHEWYVGKNVSKPALACKYVYAKCICPAMCMCVFVAVCACKQVPKICFSMCANVCKWRYVWMRRRACLCVCVCVRVCVCQCFEGYASEVVKVKERVSVLKCAYVSICLMMYVDKCSN